MAERLGFDFRRFLEERKLIRIRPDRKLVLKEMKGAEGDLKDANDSLKDKKFKWATVQGYYSMFHSARALIYSKGFREKSHYALFVALRELFKNEIDPSLVQNFKDAMDLREEADYGLVFSETGAIEVIKSAKELLNRAKKILKIEETVRN